MGSPTNKIGISLPERIEVAGIGIHPFTEDEAVHRIITGLDSGVGGIVATPNIDFCRKMESDAQTRALVDDATLILADGMPLVWASRIAGNPLPERVTGSSLIFSLSEAASAAGQSVYLLGGAPGTPEAAAEKLSFLYPGLKVVGADSPPFGFEDCESDLDGIRERVCQAAPDIVYVGLGFPKQERLIAFLSPSLPNTWFIGCGAAIGYAGGIMHRAPAWMQRAGLEWVHRLIAEPRRLAGRYFVHDLPYALRLLISTSATRLIGK